MQQAKKAMSLAFGLFDSKPDAATIRETREIRTEPELRLPRAKHQRHARVHCRDSLIGLGRDQREVIPSHDAAKQEDLPAGHAKAILCKDRLASPRTNRTMATARLIKPTHRHKTATEAYSLMPHTIAFLHLIKSRIETCIKNESRNWGSTT